MSAPHPSRVRMCFDLARRFLTRLLLQEFTLMLPTRAVSSCLHRTQSALIAASAIFILAPGAAMAQDSTATLSGLPGDAVSAYQVGAGSEQINNYVVDLAPITSSWGGSFSLGPVVKASRSASGQYFDQVIGAQSVSSLFSSGPLARPSYDLWTTPGQGINSTSNTAPASSINAANRSGRQFGLALMEFGFGNDGTFGNGDDESTVVSALVSFQRRAPSRLFVSRITALTNKPSTAGNGTASLGLGSIDAAGNVHILADSQTMVDPLRLAQREYVRVRSATRNPAVNNQLSDIGGADAARTDIVRASDTSMTTPAIIPSSIGAGGRAVAIGLDFKSDFIFEQAANTTLTTKAYLPGAAGSSRGSLTFVPQPFAPVAVGSNNAGTGISLVRTDGNTRTRGINIFGINTDGSVDATLQLQLPIIGGQMLDPTDSWNPGTNFIVTPAVHEFTHYASQTPFRGGTGQVASVVLSTGELLAAAVVTPTSGSIVPQTIDNYLVVARVSTGGAATWTTAAHTGNAAGAAGGLSKVILGDNGLDGLPNTADTGEGDGVVDTAPGAWIGRLARLTEVFPSQTAGPSISCPAFDLRGNLYFMATVALRTNDGSLEYTSALLRGNRDTSNNGYRLELLARLGDVLPGLNSGTSYQIQFMGFADNDSVASGGIFSSNIVQDAIGGLSGSLAAANAQFGSPLSLGALTFRAKIVYDIDNDGNYADPSSGASNSPDQAYNVAMVLMPRPILGDFNLDGAISVQDIFDFLAAYFTGGSVGDWNGDGAASVQDIFDFLADYFGS